MEQEKWLRQQLTSAAVDASWGSKALYVASLLFLVLGGSRLGDLELSSPQLVLGLFLVLGLSLQMVVAGLLIEIRGRCISRQMSVRLQVS